MECEQWISFRCCVQIYGEGARKEISFRRQFLTSSVLSLPDRVEVAWALFSNQASAAFSGVARAWKSRWRRGCSGGCRQLDGSPAVNARNAFSVTGKLHCSPAVDSDSKHRGVCGGSRLAGIRLFVYNAPLRAFRFSSAVLCSTRCFFRCSLKKPRKSRQI